MRLLDLIDQYFEITINDEFFILALDKTGVYAFTQSTNKPLIVDEFLEMERDLKLDKNQAVLCYVGNEGNDYEESIRVEELEDWVCTKTAERSNVLNDRDFADIIKCYRADKIEEQQIVNVLREYNISDSVIKDLINKRPQNVKEVKQLGVVDEIAFDVFRVLCSGYYERDDDDEREEIPSGISVALVSHSNKNLCVSCIMIAIGVAIMVFTPLRFLALVPSFVAVDSAQYAQKANKTIATQIVLVTATLLLITSTIFVAFALWELIKSGL